MANIEEIQPLSSLKASRGVINNNFIKSVTDLADTSFPTLNLVIGMKCYRTDHKKLYRYTAENVWTVERNFDIPLEKYLLTDDKATAAEAEAGTDNNKYITPLTFASAFNKRFVIASNAEAKAALDDTKVMTAAKVKVEVNELRPFATTTEAEQGVSDKTVMSPLAVKKSIDKNVPTYDGGTKGLVPSASTPNNKTFLCSNGEWLNIVDLLYPIGCIYISKDDTSPADLFGGSWQKVASGEVLWGSTATQKAGTHISAGAPNITGSFSAIRRGWAAGSSPKGAFSVTNITGNLKGASSDDWGGEYSFDASKSNSIYGNSTTVQPPAYVVNMWQRTG